jgi:hypothetical protein
MRDFQLDLFFYLGSHTTWGKWRASEIIAIQILIVERKGLRTHRARALESLTVASHPLQRRRGEAIFPLIFVASERERV